MCLLIPIDIKMAIVFFKHSIFMKMDVSIDLSWIGIIYEIKKILKNRNEWNKVLKESDIMHNLDKFSVFLTVLVFYL